MVNWKYVYDCFQMNYISALVSWRYLVEGDPKAPFFNSYNTEV